jgi:hypothetical protein
MAEQYELAPEYRIEVTFGFGIDEHGRLYHILIPGVRLRHRDLPMEVVGRVADVVYEALPDMLPKLQAAIDAASTPKE